MREKRAAWIYCDPGVLLFCFFLLTQWTWREQALCFFYRSHATSQWSMDAGPLQTYTVEHALCGSAKRGHLGERGSTPPHSLTYHLSSLLLSLPSYHSLYILFLLKFCLFPSLPLNRKPPKDGVMQQRSDGGECKILCYSGLCPWTYLYLQYFDDLIISLPKTLISQNINVSVNSFDLVF